MSKVRDLLHKYMTNRFKKAYEESSLEYEGYKLTFSDFKDDFAGIVIGLLLTNGHVDDKYVRTNEQKKEDFNKYVDHFSSEAKRIFNESLE